jgi:hypothetical protein
MILHLALINTTVTRILGLGELNPKKFYESSVFWFKLIQTSRAMIFVVNSGAKSSKFRRKNKNFRKILMPTNLHLFFLKSLEGARVPFAHSWLWQCL